jgi:hypothetical protein
MYNGAISTVAGKTGYFAKEMQEANGARSALPQYFSLELANFASTSSVLQVLCSTPHKSARPGKHPNIIIPSVNPQIPNRRRAYYFK